MLSKLTFKKINSTNEKAKELAKKGLFDVVVVAEEQINGKGRFNRTWFSSEGGLYFSILLKEKNIEKAKYLTFIAAVSVVKSIEKVGLKTKIKWPNDVHINMSEIGYHKLPALAGRKIPISEHAQKPKVFDKKKLCGILTETFRDYVVVGVGLNVNQSKFNKKISNIATSLKIELNKKINKEKILNKFLEEFSKLYDLYKNKKYKKILDLLKENCDTIGKDVKVKSINRIFYGKVVDVDKDCNLILKLKNGKIKKIIEGDVSFRLTKTL